MKRNADIMKLPNIRLKVGIIIFLGIINVLLLASYFVLLHFAVRNVVVEGNKH